jgi:hypothetical protein
MKWIHAFTYSARRPRWLEGEKKSQPIRVMNWRQKGPGIGFSGLLPSHHAERDEYISASADFCDRRAIAFFSFVWPYHPVRLFWLLADRLGGSRGGTFVNSTRGRWGHRDLIPAPECQEKWYGQILFVATCSGDDACVEGPPYHIVFSCGKGGQGRGGSAVSDRWSSGLGSVDFNLGSGQYCHDSQIR